MADDDTRVVITGLGAVTCLGTGIDALWSGLVAGRSAFGPVTLFDTADLGCHLAGELPADLDLEGPFASWSARPRRRGDRIALLAAAEAMASAGLDPLPRELAPELGVAVLCGSGDALEYEDTLDAPDDPDAAGGPDPLAPAAD